MLDSEDVLSGIGELVVLLIKDGHFYPLVSSVSEPSAAIVSQEELDGIVLDAIQTETAEKPHVLIWINLCVTHAKQDVVTVRCVVNRDGIR